MIQTLNIKRVGVLAIGLLFALMLALPVFAAAESSKNIVRWDGKGSDSIVDCKENQAPFLKWVLTPAGGKNGFDKAELFAGKTSYGEMQQQGKGAFQLTTGIVDLSLNIYAKVNGKTGNAVLTISEGCVAPYVPQDEYFFQFAKEWQGDTKEVDLTKLGVSFVADGDFKWTLGVDAAVKVEPGETTLTNVKEVITGLPETCTYTSDLPSTVAAPENLELYGENKTLTLTVTNTIECEEDKDDKKPVPVVPTDDKDKKEVETRVVTAVETREVTQVVAPVGAVDAGVGAVAHVAGLFSSLTAVGAGLVSRKLKL
jgi:hypothetical protein